MTDDRDQSSMPAHGVDTLIERLRDQGVAEGRRRAEELVEDAESRAKWVVEQAEAEAEQIRTEARREADHLRESAREAISTAARDTVLELHGQLVARFRNQVQWLIRTELDKEEFVQQLILALAGQLRENEGLDQAGRMDVVLPESAVALEELRREPEALREGTLTYFVVAVANEMLREGVSIQFDPEQQTGLKLRLKDEGMEVDLTQDTVAELLLRHLQPRFRALLEGVLR